MDKLLYSTNSGGINVYPINAFGVNEGKGIVVHPFTEEAMKLIPENAVYGNYRIGIIRGNTFCVQYFGRSDHNDGGLRKRVSDHLAKGNPTDSQKHIYDESYYFWFKVQESERDAFRQECYDWHNSLDPDGENFVDNKYHPARPAGCICPVCLE